MTFMFPYNPSWANTDNLMLMIPVFSDAATACLILS